MGGGGGEVVLDWYVEKLVYKLVTKRLTNMQIGVWKINKHTTWWVRDWLTNIWTSE